MITYQRAAEIAKLIRKNRGWFQVGRDVTREENAEIEAFWTRLETNTSYYTAVERMGWGWHYPGVDPQTGRVRSNQGED